MRKEFPQSQFLGNKTNLGFVNRNFRLRRKIVLKLLIIAFTFEDPFKRKKKKKKKKKTKKTSANISLYLGLFRSPERNQGTGNQYFQN